MSTMAKATLLLGAILSYFLGIYLSPQLLPCDYLTSLILPLVDHKKGSKSPAANEVPPIELPPLPPSLSPRNKATSSAASDVKSAEEIARRAYEEKRQAAEDARKAAEEARQNYNPVDSYRTLLGIQESTNHPDPFENVQFVIHRNGEPEPCSHQRPNANPSQSFVTSAQHLYQDYMKPLEDFDKYDFDAMLTHALAVGSTPPKFGGIKDALLLFAGRECGPTWQEDNHYLDSITMTFSSTTSAETLNKSRDKMLISSFLKYCDMGLDRTPIQLDHGRLRRLPGNLSYPCHFHTREGRRVTSLKMLGELARDVQREDGECKAGEEGVCANADGKAELHLYAVPAGRVFMFAPKHVGEIFELPHVKGLPDLPVYLEVLSLSPRVFDIYNFFSREESSTIVAKALAETSETHRMKRSSTGASGYNVNSQRTSENGFDTHGKEAQAVKRRCMDVLGFDDYEESLTDGLQVLRYNKTTAYGK